MVIIGSTAIKFYFPDFPREPKDIDYLVSDKNMWDNIQGKEEYHENDVLWNYFIQKNIFPKYLYPDLLLTLKMSHLFWDINWEKHNFDVQFLLKKGCILNVPLFYELYKYWNKYHGKNKRSDLKMSSLDFFNNALKSPYDHDHLHTLIKDPPTYSKVLIGEVEVSEDKFNALSFEEKCDLVQEEVYIMAWERMPKLDYRVAYGRMLRKFIISHAPLFEAVFIIQNFKDLYKPKINYQKILENGSKKYRN